MESNWFANRGQIIQTILTGAGVLLAGINAWPAVSQLQLLTVGPVIFYVMIGLSMLIITRHSHRHVRAAMPSDGAAVEPIQGKPIDTKAVGVDYKLKHDLRRFKLPIGEAWSLDDRRVVLHDVLKNADKPRSALYPDSDYVADVEVSFGGRLIFAGPSVKENSNRHFLIPVSPRGNNAEPGGLYAYAYSPNYVNFEFFVIEHINFHKKEIDGFFAVVNLINLG